MRIKTFLILLSILIGPQLWAQETEPGKIRSLRLGFGSPAPSWVGGSMSFEILPQFELFFSSGWSRWDDLRIWSFNPHIRTRMIPNAVLSPVVGGGINFLLVSGQDTFQGVEQTVPLAQMLLGLDLEISDSLVLTSGCHFHFPVKLIFPMVEVGFIFR